MYDFVMSTINIKMQLKNDCIKKKWLQKCEIYLINIFGLKIAANNNMAFYKKKIL